MSPEAAAYPSLFLVSSIAASRLFSSLLGPRSGGIPWGWGEWLAKVSLESQNKQQVLSECRLVSFGGILSLFSMFLLSLIAMLVLRYLCLSSTNSLAIGASQRYHCIANCGSFLRLSRSLLLSSSPSFGFEIFQKQTIVVFHPFSTDVPLPKVCI